MRYYGTYSTNWNPNLKIKYVLPTPWNKEGGRDEVKVFYQCFLFLLAEMWRIFRYERFYSIQSVLVSTKFLSDETRGEKIKYVKGCSHPLEFSMKMFATIWINVLLLPSKSILNKYHILTPQTTSIRFAMNSRLSLKWTYIPEYS